MKLSIRVVIVYGSALLFAAGCSNTASQTEDSNPATAEVQQQRSASIEFPIAFYERYSDAQPTSGYESAGSTVELLWIPYGLVGRPFAPALKLTVDDRGYAALDSEQMATFSDDSKVIRSAPRFVKSEPEDCRFGRLGTFIELADTTINWTEAGFIDSTSGGFLWLVYSDQACHLTGREFAQGVNFETDVMLPAAGFHWLALESTSDEVDRVSLAADSALPVFAIELAASEP